MHEYPKKKGASESLRPHQLLIFPVVSFGTAVAIRSATTASAAAAFANESVENIEASKTDECKNHPCSHRHHVHLHHSAAAEDHANEVVLKEADEPPVQRPDYD